MIPLQKPLITSEHLHEKLVQPETDAVGVSQPPPLQLHNNAIAVAVDNNISECEAERPLQAASPSAIDFAKPQSDSACDSVPLVNPTTDISSTKSMKKDIKRTKRLEKKRLKQQKKQQKQLQKKIKKQKDNEKNNNRQENGEDQNETNFITNQPMHETPQSNLKNRLQTFQEPTVPRAKSKSPVNVTFAFDTIDSASDAAANNHHHHHHQQQLNRIVHLHNDIGDINDSNANGMSDDRKSNGDYDSLPLIQVEKSADDIESDFATDSNAEKMDGNGNVVVVTSHTVLPISCSSSDSIPFIDDSPNPRRATSIPIDTRQNLHDSRFITLQPRNIGAQSMIYARKLEKPLPIAFKIPTKRDQFDKSAQILYQSLKESIDHHFERAAHLHNKLCQVCHEFLLVPDAVKCLTCGLVCHHTCTLPQVYTFLSFEFIIYFLLKVTENKSSTLNENHSKLLLKLTARVVSLLHSLKAKHSLIQ